MNEIKLFIADNISGFSPKNIPSFLFSLVICAILSYSLGKLYAHYGNSLSNRKAFARNFLLLALTTMFIITVVKSSLALSLGLVGALSIVRFRAAIKEPEELTYLFLNIAIGLGCGAGLSILTVIAFICFAFFIWFSNKNKSDTSENSLYLTISSSKGGGSSNLGMDAILTILSKHCSFIKLKRSDESKDAFEIAFLVGIDNVTLLQQVKEEVREAYPDAVITFLDSSRDI